MTFTSMWTESSGASFSNGFSCFGLRLGVFAKTGTPMSRTMR
jgi:hypothetical protein